MDTIASHFANALHTGYAIATWWNRLIGENRRSLLLLILHSKGKRLCKAQHQRRSHSRKEQLFRKVCNNQVKGLIRIKVKLVTSISQNTNVEMKAFPIRLQENGQITVPQPVQDNLNLTEGDMLTLLQVGNLVLLTPKQPQVPQLADKITAIMEAEGITLTDLLDGIETEREAIWQEQQNA